MENIIDVKNLSKTYGQFKAVDGISFQVRRGETFGILGPNGAGKTTTLEMIEGLKPISSGSVLLDGLDVARQTRQVKQIIGVQLQSSAFFDGLNLAELIETFASLYERRVNPVELLEAVQLADKSRNTAKELSGGQRQRLSIAVALVNRPKVLFLDEPTTGLDPQARRNLWDLVTKINGSGTTIVLTTHYMDEAETLCDRIAVMDKAKIAALDNTENLLRTAGVGSSVHFRSDRPINGAALSLLPGATGVSLEGHGARLATDNPESLLPALFRLAREENFKMFDLQLKQPTLEDVFLKLTGHQLRE